MNTELGIIFLLVIASMALATAAPFIGNWLADRLANLRGRR